MNDTDLATEREALARTIFDAWQGKGFDAEFEYQKFEWLEVADAILAAGFRRSPAPQQVSTVEELAALPITSVVLDVFAAVCVRASDSAGALDWRRVTPAVRGGEHRHFPYLPATVLYRPEGGEQ